MDFLKKRQRFTDHDDLVLLREVLSQNPFENSSLWVVVQENMSSVTGKIFSIRTLKEHLERLVKLWFEQYQILKDKSGIEIQFTEKETLLHNIYDLMQEFKFIAAKKKRLCSGGSTSKILGVEARDKWTQLLEESSSSSSKASNVMTSVIIHDHGSLTKPYKEATVNGVLKFQNEEDKNRDMETSANEINQPTVTDTSDKPLITPTKTSATPSTKILGTVRSRKRKINTQRQGLAYLEQYDKEQAELKKKQLEIEERKIVLEEKRLQLMERQHNLAEFQAQKQIEMEEKRINLEIQSRESLFAIVERQEKLINLLINKLH